MINAAELRIGNWVRLKVTDNVTGDSNEKDVQWGIALWRMYINPSSTSYNQEFNYIPLTEEWLVRFGFKEWTGWYYLKLKSLGDEFTLCYAPNEYLLMLNIGEKTIKYKNPKVHQLQNLVFDLEGVELEMK